MHQVADESVDLVVTSPPYPMIEMWDQIFFGLNGHIKSSFDQHQFPETYELMHQELDKVWAECIRVTKPGGIICINIGDATRTLAKNFQLYPNHARIVSYFSKERINALPSIIWSKPTNAPNKFMGSGMLPSNAYITLEHEWILIFRKGEKRVVKPIDRLRRQESAYFWEERNTWFSNIWSFTGVGQKLSTPKKDDRTRSGAYPLELPHRLINMFSIKGDTVLDPFLGTGTTTKAAIINGRNSIGIEIDDSFKSNIIESCLQLKPVSDVINKSRLTNHQNFIEEYRERKQKVYKYTNTNYGFPVMTKQELNIKFDTIQSIHHESPDAILVKTV